MLEFLLAIADEDDHEKIIYLYEHYHREMLRVARYRLAGQKNGYSDAEDVVQEAFLGLVKSIKKIDFNVEPNVLRAYVMVSVENAVRDYFYNLNRHFAYSIDDYLEMADEGALDMASQLSIKDQYENVVKAIQEMNELYRIPMEWLFLHGKTYDEISEALQIPVTTVYTRVRRGKLILMKHLENA